MALSVACFADAGPKVGSGHIFRIYPVLEALIDLRASAKMFTPVTPRELKSMKVAHATAADAAKFSRHVKRDKPSALLIDSYRERDFLFASAADAGIALFDDHYAPPAGLSILVNASPAATPRRYPKNPATLLLGPQFASLHSAFRAARTRFRVRASVCKVLVALGGNDTTGSLAKVVETLRQILPAATLVVCGAPDAKILTGPNIDRRPWLDQTQVADALASCDLAVLAGGQMLVQSACIGVPAISLPQSDNQILHASAWQKIGSAVVVKNSARLTSAITRLLSRETRAKMSAAGRATVDGLGARRIARALLKN